MNFKLLVKIWRRFRKEKYGHLDTQSEKISVGEKLKTGPAAKIGPDKFWLGLNLTGPKMAATVPAKWAFPQHLKKF